jgi:hypothetical protein
MSHISGGLSEPNFLAINAEGEVITWCVKPSDPVVVHVLQDVQLMKTLNYVQVVGSTPRNS